MDFKQLNSNMNSALNNAMNSGSGGLSQMLGTRSGCAAEYDNMIMIYLAISSFMLGMYVAYDYHETDMKVVSVFFSWVVCIGLILSLAFTICNNSSKAYMAMVGCLILITLCSSSAVVFWGPNWIPIKLSS